MLLLIILAVSAILRLIYITLPATVWWDTAVYIGIGKNLFSNGTLGMWEAFRPVFWPALLGFFWKMGLDPLFTGKVLEVIFALGIIYFVYKLGELAGKNIGLYAAALTAFSPVFFIFTNIPITDIPSTFFTLCAIYAAVKDRFIWAGLAVGIAFGFRFPQAIALFAIGIGLILIYRANWRAWVARGVQLGLGFAIVFVPYSLGNFMVHDDPFFPIKLGNTVFAASLGASPWYYYISKSIIQNPFLLFAAAIAFDAIRNLKKINQNPAVIFSLIMFLIFLIYYSLQPHKEIRYGIAFLPFLAVLAGYGIAKITDRFMIIKPTYATAVIAVALTGILYFATAALPPWYSPAYAEYYNYLRDKPRSRVVTTSPQVHAHADLITNETVNVWEDMPGAIGRARLQADYLLIDTSLMHCKSDAAACNNARFRSEQSLRSLNRVFATSTGQYTLRIYKIR